MALKDLEHYLKKGGTKAMLLVALEASALNVAAQDKQNDNLTQQDKQKTEYTLKKVNLFGAAEVEQIVQDGELYNKLGNNLFDESHTDRKKMKKEWKADEKEAFANAEPDRVDTVSIVAADRAGAYDTNSKNIVMTHVISDPNEIAKAAERFSNRHPEMTPEQKRQTFNGTLEMLADLNNPQSQVYKSVKAHEEQHRTNDKLGIYGPGLSPEQYGILCQYDECAASVAELNSYLTGYKEALSNGRSKEEALKIFDKEPDFAFYKEALAKGLDPDSKEGKKLMMEGTFNMWQTTRRGMNGYKSQVAQFGVANIGSSDLSSTLIGNEQELRKRIDKIFDNICKNDYCKEAGIKEPGNLSKYLPEKLMDLLPEVRAEIEGGVKGVTGIDAQQRETIKQSIDGKSDKAKNRKLLQVFTGRKSPEQIAAKKSGFDRQPTKDNAAVKRAIAAEMAKTH